MKEYKQGDYSLRRFLPEEWETYRDIRLEALQTNPEVFSASYQDQSLLTEDDWRSRLESDDRAVFGLYHKDEIVGLTGITLDEEILGQAELILSFIRPSHRGQRLGELFYQARIDWAREKGCDLVIATPRADNGASISTNQRFAFVHEGTEKTKWSNGVEVDQTLYKLELNK